MGLTSHQKRQGPGWDRDDEGKRESKFRRVLFRVHGRVTQWTNMRATAEQNHCDRDKSDK